MKARQIVPGKSFMLTRRTSQRQFLLRPCYDVVQVFRYCLGLSQQRTGVKLHASAIMSNHHHTVGTDPEARLPELSHCFHTLLGRALNYYHGRRENFWAGGVQPSHVHPEEPNDLISQIVYTVTNPVKAGLVSSHRLWPGDVLWKPGTYKVKRPKFFFRQGDDATLPEVVDLVISAPEIPGQSEKETMKQIKEAIAEKEGELRAEFKNAGRAFLGASKVKETSFFSMPKTRSIRSVRGGAPSIAAKCKIVRERAEERLKDFLTAYQEALKAWRLGNKEVVFPAGTYQMATVHGAVWEPCVFSCWDSG